MGGGRGILSVHYDMPIFLPFSWDSYDGTYLTSPGRCNIPACIPLWDSATEKKFLDSVLDDLNKNLLSGRDKEPNLSRSANRPAIRTGAVENMIFVGSSNANQLAFSAAALGVDTYKHAQGGWKVTKESVDKLIPDLKNTLSSVPPDTPVVFFCLDNSSFMGLKDDGNIAVISKCVEGDDGFHVIGEHVVAPERALSHVHTQLKRATDACEGHPVFIVTPWPRFVRTPCCSDSGHVTNFNIADFLSSILGDLNKHKAALRRAVPTATVIDGLELISGPGYNTEKAAAVINSGWAFDPVHPSKHVYAKMALNLLEKIAPSSKTSGSGGRGHQHADSRKRSWCSSNQGGGSGVGASSRGGGFNSPRAASGGGRQTARSQQWKEGGRRDSFRSAHSGSSDGGGMHDRRFSGEKHPRSYGDGGGGYGPDYYGQYHSGRGGGRGGGAYGGRF